MLNLVVTKSLSRTSDLDDIRTRARRIVAHFKSSTTAKEKLSEIQRQMGRPEHKLLQEVETRWNSTFTMLQRLLNTTLLPLSAEDYDTINQCLSVLSLVSGSKVIPIVKMLKHLASRQCASITHPIASNLVNNIHTNLQEKFAGLEKVTSLTLATLLDPRFKEVGFCSMTNCQAAVERLTRECASVIPAPAQPLPPAEGPSHIQSNSLWDHLDSHVDAQRVSNCTASAIAEVQRTTIDLT
ncbi:putative zinc finger BED domain-containing protein 4-like [Triplophysa rosa]|uniref:Zinc finger BED domain-containing protein 4-like n=1 Tax=Triplophysa rosa TaxID=992332 RepID=A0A9W7WFC4_TRIRA|nr:putative zinc finger BED domain-containing protein 4-like [Triplophysa rosa]